MLELPFHTIKLVKGKYHISIKSLHSFSVCTVASSASSFGYFSPSGGGITEEGRCYRNIDWFHCGTDITEGRCNSNIWLVSLWYWHHRRR